MSNPETRLLWVQGTNLTVTIRILEPDGETITDITGGSFLLAAREDVEGADIFTIAGTNNGGVAGTIDFLFTPALAAIAYGNNHWDVVGLLNAEEFQAIEISELVVKRKMADL